MKHYNALAFCWVAAILFLTPSLGQAEGGKKSCLKKRGRSASVHRRIDFDNQVSRVLYQEYADEDGDGESLEGSVAMPPSALPEAMKAHHHHLSSEIRTLHQFIDMTEMPVYRDQYNQLVEGAYMSGNLVKVQDKILEDLKKWVNNVNQFRRIYSPHLGEIDYEIEAEHFENIFRAVAKDTACDVDDPMNDDAISLPSPISDYGFPEDVLVASSILQTLTPRARCYSDNNGL